MNKLTHPAPIEPAALLDHFAHAANLIVRTGDESEGSSYFLRAMDRREQLAFDLFLVATEDPLAYEAGTPEHRFSTKVVKMAQQFVEWKQSLEAAPEKNDLGIGVEVVFRVDDQTSEVGTIADVREATANGPQADTVFRVNASTGKSVGWFTADELRRHNRRRTI